MSITIIEYRVLSHHLHTSDGGVPGAARLAKRTGLPIQHMRPNGSVVVVWIEKGKRRQKTYPAALVRVEHTGKPFFLTEA